MEIVSLTTSDLECTGTDNGRQEVMQIIQMPSREEEQVELDTAATTNWSKQATLDLISLHQQHDHYFQSSEYKKRAVWEMISKKMKQKGFNYASVQVENKWKSLTKAYRDVVNHNLKNGHIVTRTCAFFKELSEVYHYIPECAQTPSMQQSVVQIRGGKRNSEDFTDTDTNLQKKKKFLNLNCSETQSSSDIQSFSSVLKTFNEERRKQDKIKMDKLEKMHREKMEMFSSFLKVFKDSLSK
ncbi:hypothetical protein LOTGIDRAFT_157131 [Lottia gigantea]|uniref:Myb/SANT-like DNA-binding domain-containing protein n=1 Tax=Lottia gigantea TaxID=225164 RepID=V4ADB5_LOTGI|nr:hypothetical protein LOTGIDRAFT_157131 [Lottia gigantea]ESP01994.1 hypothetical protein LOTGIDRAFT_157131 [Lottia gigantea]